MKHICRICSQELPPLLQELAEQGGTPLCGYTVCETTGKTDAQAPRLPKPQKPEKPEVGCIVRLLDVHYMCMDQAKNGQLARIIKESSYQFTIVPHQCDWKHEKQYYLAKEWLAEGYFELVSGPEEVA